MGIDDFTGQERIKRFFRRTKALDRLHHCYILEGPEGYGTRPLVSHLARLVNCSESPDDYCGRCIACRKFSKRLYTDYHELVPLEGKKQISIKQVRELAPVLHFAPIEGGLRVVVIDKAEQLTREAQNALLKTLEEPPPDNLFFLLTENRTMFLDTILSRGELVRMSRPSPDETAALLAERRPGLGDAEARRLVDIAGGRPELVPEDADSAAVEELSGFIDRVFTGDTGAVFELSSLFHKKKDRARGLFPVFMSLLKAQLLEHRTSAAHMALYERADEAGRLFDEINLNPALCAEHLLLSLDNITDRR